MLSTLNNISYKLLIHTLICFFYSKHIRNPFNVKNTKKPFTFL